MWRRNTRANFGGHGARIARIFRARVFYGNLAISSPKSETDCSFVMLYHVDRFVSGLLNLVQALHLLERLQISKRN